MAAAWYPDPWNAGQHRFWDGEGWTAHAFPDGAGVTGEHPAGSLATSAALGTLPATGSTPPPPDWNAPAARLPDLAPADAGGGPAGGPTRSWWPPHGRTLVALLLLVAFAAGLIGSLLVTGHRSAARTAAPAATPATPGSTPSTTPSATPSTTPGALTPGGDGSNDIPALPASPGSGLSPSSPGSSTAPSPLGPGFPSPTPPSSSAPIDPNQMVLSGLVLQQSDVPAGVTVATIPGGDQVSGQATLDLCNGTFASEALRTSRLQVAATDGQGNEVLSTEAVIYSSPAAAAQAMSELKSVAAKCPSSPVVSPVGEPTVTTQFNAAPDTSWPPVANVQRLAYDFTTTDQTGSAQRNIAVYLQRGRVLMGVYFAETVGAQASVDGQTTAAGIVHIFETRIAQLPASTVNG
jgi:Protein of unknown function (DUF2510)